MVSNDLPNRYQVVEATVRKGDTEWQCSECGTVTEVDPRTLEKYFDGGNLSTKRCSGCERMMQGETPPKDRETYENWKNSSVEEADALQW